MSRMNTPLRKLPVAVLRTGWLALACILGSVAHAQSPWRFTDVQRFVAVSDIHGAYDGFERILRKSGLIDEALQWSGGSDQLIIVGDVLDRGADSRKALELIMRLEAQAQETGGAVRFVLGNHELMNIVGDLRYVADAEYAAFAADETAEMRADAFAALNAAEAEAAGIDTPGIDAAQRASLQAEFDRRYPPGFFAHRAAFAPDGRYGAWLLEQPFLVVVNEWAFVHGGLARAGQALLAEEFNAVLQQQLNAYAVALGVLTATGVVGPGDNFYDHPGLLAAWSERVDAGTAVWPDAAAESAANIVVDLNAAFPFDISSPAWYRGNVACSPLIEADRLSASLALAGAEHLVIGHTPSRDASIHSRLDGAVYRIDTGMLREYYGGRAAALIVEGDSVQAIYEDIAEPQPVMVQGREVGRRPNGMTNAQLEEFLATAQVVGTQDTADSRWRSVTLRTGDLELNAMFTPNPGRNLQPDLAAYRLDKRIGLDMVPATVAREIDGDAGTLQYLPPVSISEEERQAERLGGDAWCPLNDQFAAMYVFDSLIGNTGRTLDRLRYSTDSFELMLLGHDLSFPTSSALPQHLSSVELTLTPAWIERLQSLTEEELETAFEGFLDRRRVRALLGRRDAILEAAAAGP